MDVVDNNDGDVRGIMHDLQSHGLHSEIIQFCQWAREQGIPDVFEAMKLAKKIGLENDDENEMAYEGYLRLVEFLGLQESLDANQKRAGKKGTLTKSRMDGMKMSSPYSMRGGPKGVLPEGQEDLDTIRRLLGK